MLHKYHIFIKIRFIKLFVSFLIFYYTFVQRQLMLLHLTQLNQTSLILYLITPQKLSCYFQKIDCQYKCNILCLCCSEDLCRCFISKTLARSIIYYIYYNIKLILSYSRKIKSFRIKLS